MFDTANLKLPLLAQSQAQKHVIVNEALSVLDAISQLNLVSRTLEEPPFDATDGQAYFVPASATGDWAEHSGKLAIYSNNGWNYVAPRRGWRGFIEDEDRIFLFDGSHWIREAITTSQHGAGSGIEVLEFDHDLSPGASSQTLDVIPAFSLVFGVTGRVRNEIAGTLNSWNLGITGAETRYGASLQTSVQSMVFAQSPVPVTTFEPTPLLLKANGGVFSSGSVRLAVHLMRLHVPRV